MQIEVLRFENFERSVMDRLLERFGLQIETCAAGAPIPGSYWGDDEAGLIGNRVYVRADTPLHSILHEACHYICVDPARRGNLDTNAGSDDSEENAVCYLQVLLADEIAGFGRERMFVDMDAWGYSFRLGSSRAWFENDADDALAWLRNHGLVDREKRPLYRLRG